MAKVLYSATMSLDGFIAGPGGDMSWLTEYLGPNPTVDELIGQIGALLVGNRTFGGDDPHRGTPRRASRSAAGGPGRSSCSPTTRQALRCPVSPSSVTSTAGSRRRRPPRARSTSTSSAPARPGSASMRACSTRCCVFVAPVLLGDGVRLFEYPGGTNIRLERLSVSQAPTATSLWFRVRR